MWPLCFENTAGNLVGQRYCGGVESCWNVHGLQAKYLTAQNFSTFSQYIFPIILNFNLDPRSMNMTVVGPLALMVIHNITVVVIFNQDSSGKFSSK